MAKSGYEAVYDDLNRSPEAEAVLDTLRMWLETARVAGWSFRVHSQSDSGVADTWTLWDVRFGDQEINFWHPEYTGFRIDFDSALGESAARIVHRNFGVEGRVGTRNCKAEVVLRGRSGSSSGRGAVRFYHEALLEHVNGHPVLSTLRQEAEARIVDEMIRISQTEEFATGRRRALEEEAKEEIRKIMFKYRDLPADFVDEAVREAQVYGVLEA